MSDQDVFDTDGNPVNTQQDPFADKLSSILNENGEPKYKTVETALDALKASQEHIRKLEQDNRDLANSKAETDAELAKMGSIEDFVNKISPAAQPKSDPEPQGQENVLSEDKIAELLENKLASQRKAEVETNNLNSVISKLVEAHGDQTQAFISQKAVELNTTPAALKDMAKSNPTVALSLLGGGSKSNTTPASSLSVNNSDTKKQEDGPPKRERSVVHGGMTNQELASYWREVADFTNKKLGVES